MDEKIKQLNEKVDKLQSTLDWMIERMWRAQSLKSLETMPQPETNDTFYKFIGGGTTGYITTSEKN